MLKLKLQYFGILMQKDDSLAKFLASLVDQMVKSLTAVRETQVWSLGQEDPLEKELATHSSILAWKSPWMEEPGRLQSMGLQRVRHSWATSLSLSDAGKDWGQKEKRASEDEMAGWHHQCNGHELGQSSGDGGGQGSLSCCSPLGCKELDTAGWLNSDSNHLVLGLHTLKAQSSAFKILTLLLVIAPFTISKAVLFPCY